MNDWTRILQVSIANGPGILLEIGPLLLVALGLALGIRLFKGARFQRYEVVEADISLGGMGRLTLRPSNLETQIAHKAWVELATRKVAVPFDEQNDLIVEIYDSWYELFREMRSLTKEIPAHRVRTNENTSKLVSLLVDSLNKGLRPHLTQWQGRFRRWYSHAVKVDPSRPPQEIQRQYPEYNKLASDLKRVNNELREYTEFIRRIAHGG